MDFSSKVPDNVVCNWFYAFYVINAIVAIFAVMMLLFGLFMKGGNPMKMLLTVRSVQLLLMVTIAAVNSMFFYIICQRALKPTTAA